MGFNEILPYVGFGIAGIVGILVLSWLWVAVRVILNSKGLPQSLNLFFAAIVTGNLDAAYGMTTADFQKRTSKKQFAQFIKTSQLKQYKRLELPLFDVKDGRCPLDLTIELKSGSKVPLHLDLLKSDKTWKIDALEKGSLTIKK